MFGGNYYEEQQWGGRSGRPARRFDEFYRCYPVVMMSMEREGVNEGGKVFLPPSALDKLTKLEIAYPMLFELVNGSKGKTTHSGVLEFIAEEGRIYLPQWIMNCLLLEPGDLLQVKSTDLPSGSFIKLQPQSVAFLDISDPKAVLENALGKFSALTKGDIFSFSYNDTIYEIAVLEVKPESKAGAISVTETDIEVDFAAPIGYVEPQRSVPASVNSTRPSSAAAGNVATLGQGPMAAKIGYNDMTPSAPAGIGGSSLKVPEAFLRGGQKLSGKKSKTASPAPTPPVTAPPTTSSMFKRATPQSKIINASTMSSDAPVPKPLRLPHGQLFFGYEIKPLSNENYGIQDEKEAQFGGSGQTLRGGDGKGKGKRKERDDSAARATSTSTPEPAKGKTGRTLRGNEVIEID